MTTTNTPKMRTNANQPTPLTPEQVRAVVSRHESIMRHRRYLTFRTVCRALFWFAAGALALWVAAKTGALDDYESTCEALGKVCGKP